MDILEQLENLNNQIKECTDNKTALDLQKKLIDLLNEVFKNEELLKSLVNSKNTKN